MAETGKGDSKGRGAKSRQGATSEAAKTPKPINCQLPGAELLEQGKSVEEVMQELEKGKNPVGRPSIKTPELVDTILTMLMEGNSLVKITKREDMPSYPTICAWLAKDAEFLKRYEISRQVQADYLADEILDIADDSAADELFTEDGKRVCNTEYIQRSRLRVDARKWVASKLLPKKYGDKVEQTLQNADGSALALTVNFVSPDKA